MMEKLKEALARLCDESGKPRYCNDYEDLCIALNAARAYSELAEKVEGLRQILDPNVGQVENYGDVRYNAALDAVLEILKEQNK